MDAKYTCINGAGREVRYFDIYYRGADKYLARPGRKQATATKL